MSRCTDPPPDAATAQKSNSHGQRGFTLLEVMIALAIVATVLVALLGLQARTIRMSEIQQRITQATLLAQERMSDIENFVSTNARDDDGRFEQPFANYRWKVRYEPTPLASVRQVTVTVAWGNEGNNEEVSLTSFLLR